MLNQAAFTASAYHDGLSFLREHMGTQVFDRRIELRDDATDSSKHVTERMVYDELKRLNLNTKDLRLDWLRRNCVPGSIHVDKLFEVQSYPTVHHLVSTISGELRDGATALDLLRDSFPGGSITGAPKRRAMEIIAELEPASRLGYCGSVAYISADGRMDSNITIRSLWCENGELLCWGGGGIVADSQWQQEYRETFDKVGRFLASLEETLDEPLSG